MRLPRGRGGVPQYTTGVFSFSPSSPRVWGCFWLALAYARIVAIFPVSVGCFHGLVLYRRFLQSLPHLGRGVPSISRFRPSSFFSSPGQLGCFPLHDGLIFDMRAFLTLMWVFPSSKRTSQASVRIPHGSGGVSKTIKNVFRGVESSPHQLGCFHGLRRCDQKPGNFPTPVGGVFPIDLY